MNRATADRSRAVRISPNLAGIAGSETLRISALAAELRASGVPVISLSAGEPDFDTPAHIREAGIAAIRAGHTRYTATAGIPALRAAIAEKLRRENGISYEPEEVLVSAGAKQVLFSACVALFGPGDDVLIPAPYWVSFPAMVRFARAEPVIVPADPKNGYKVSAELLREAVTPRTRGLILNSPSNPTGAVYDEGELAAIAELCVEHEIWILSDEIYEKLCYDRDAAPSMAATSPEARARTITVNGFSKTYAMTGWRLGYGAGPRDVVAAMEIVQSHSTSNSSSVAQHAALAALTETAISARALSEMREAFRRRRELLLAGLEGLAGVSSVPPRGGFYVWSDVRELLAAIAEGAASRRGSGAGVGRAGNGGSGGPAAGADDFCASLLETHALALVPGTAFGAEGHVRWSFAASDEQIAEGVRRFRSAVLGAGST